MYEIQPVNLRERLHLIKPASILKNVLFFNHWEDPADFYTMTSDERATLFSRYMTLSTQPTEDNHWIWFGSYQKGKGHPRIGQKSVVQILYSTLIQPVNGHRVRSLTATTKSDINPFKYKHGEIPNRFALIQEYKKNAVNISEPEALANGLATLTPEELARFNSQVEGAKADIKTYFYPHISDTVEEMRTTLLYQGYEELVIDEALNQTKDTYPWRKSDSPATAPSIQA